jgi:hypothetical protein
VGTGFRKRSCSTNKLERDDDAKKSHHALARELAAFTTWTPLRSPAREFYSNSRTRAACRYGWPLGWFASELIATSPPGSFNCIESLSKNAWAWKQTVLTSGLCFACPFLEMRCIGKPSFGLTLGFDFQSCGVACRASVRSSVTCEPCSVVVDTST